MKYVVHLIVLTVYLKNKDKSSPLSQDCNKSENLKVKKIRNLSRIFLNSRKDRWKDVKSEFFVRSGRTYVLNNQVIWRIWFLPTLLRCKTNIWHALLCNLQAGFRIRQIIKICFLVPLPSFYIIL